jgi:hypothetical protein
MFVVIYAQLVEDEIQNASLSRIRYFERFADPIGMRQEYRL